MEEESGTVYLYNVNEVNLILEATNLTAVDHKVVIS